MGPYDSRAIANKIFDYAKSRGKSLTMMQLIKLVYLANGWSLALLDRQLVEDRVQAWQYGPVYPRLYKALNHNGSATIKEPVYQDFAEVPYSVEVLPDEERLIQSVVNAYGDRHAFQLSEMMHRDGTPWTTTFREKGAYSEIPQDLIKSHFLRLKDERTRARSVSGGS